VLSWWLGGFEGVFGCGLEREGKYGLYGVRLRQPHCEASGHRTALWCSAATKTDDTVGRPLSAFLSPPEQSTRQGNSHGHRAASTTLVSTHSVRSDWRTDSRCDAGTCHGWRDEEPWSATARWKGADGLKLVAPCLRGWPVYRMMLMIWVLLGGGGVGG
jgi:hypothetical protein